MRKARVTPRAASRVRAGIPWVRGADVVSVEPELPGNGERDCVVIHDGRGVVASALLNDGARGADDIVLRVYRIGAEEAFDRTALGARIATAAAARRILRIDADAVRIVHAEADGIPGLIVDRYGDAFVIQTVARALDRREATVADLLVERFGARLVVARDDTSAREREGLPRRKGLLRGDPPAVATFREGAVTFEVDLLDAPKTGAFLDQIENHAAAAMYAGAGCEALDLFSAMGGFALALAARGARVLAIDENAASLAVAERAASRAGLADRIHLERADAFERARGLESEGRRFDLVVVDPPALAKRRAPLAATERAYVELNLRALRLLRPGGVLVTCSCSARITREDFAAILARAAAAAQRPVQVLERRGAGRDHPGLLGVPETEYLKCWILRTP